MLVEMWPLDRIKPYERNARKIPQSAIDKVALSLREFGAQQPIVVDAQGIIIVGHVRRLAALQERWTDFPVTVASGLTPAQVKAYRLMDNRSHEEATWDLGLLGPELTDLKGLNLDLSLSGFDARELRMILPADSRADEVPETPEVAKTKPGFLWILGKHRVFCGDCT